MNTIHGVLPVDGDRFIDHLVSKMSLKSDAALSRALDVAPPVISKIRRGKMPVGASMILAIHEKFAMPVSDIRRAMA